MFIAVTILAAAANAFAAANDFIRPKWLLANMARVGVPESRLPLLGVLKTAGALGLLVGIGVPLVGTAAAAGLVLFFIGAIITHLRARDYGFGSLGVAVVFLLLAVAALGGGPTCHGIRHVSVNRRISGYRDLWVLYRAT